VHLSDGQRHDQVIPLLRYGAAAKIRFIAITSPLTDVALFHHTLPSSRNSLQGPGKPRVLLARSRSHFAYEDSRTTTGTSAEPDQERKPERVPPSPRSVVGVGKHESVRENQKSFTERLRSSFVGELAGVEVREWGGAADESIFRFLVPRLNVG
jgi:hypothetical protein